MKPYIDPSNYLQLRNAAFTFGVTIDEMKKAISIKNTYDAVCAYFKKYPASPYAFFSRKYYKRR